jgi:hypothetical protein
MQNLKSLSDSDLELQIKSLVAQERAVLTRILDHLREVEDRKLHLKRGCGSLFDYATRELGYSEASAARRIDAMRLLRQIPEVRDKIAAGSLSLCTSSFCPTLTDSGDRRGRVSARSA